MIVFLIVFTTVRQPNCVLWALTKKHSAFKRQQPGARARHECFSADPMNLTNMHNASSQGFTSDNAIGLQCNKAESASKKGFRREYSLLVAHKSTNGRKAKKNSAAGLHHSNQNIRRGTAHAAKSIQGLTFCTSTRKALLLRRLGRLHGASRDIVKNASSKK